MVSHLKRRFLAELQLAGLKLHPSLLSLRLVKRGPCGVAPALPFAAPAASQA